MQQRAFSIRGILLLTIGALTLLIAGLSARTIHLEWRKIAQIHALKQVSLISDQLFDASEKLSVERDVAFAMLYAPDQETVDSLRPALLRNRQSADEALNKSFAELKENTAAQVQSQLRKTLADYENLKKLRALVDRESAVPFARRQPGLPRQWFEETTNFILQSQDLWMGLSKQIVSVDPKVVLHMRFKHLLALIMEYSGRERCIIGQLLAENAAPTPQQQVELLEWQGGVDMDWRIADTLAGQGGLYPAIAPYFKDAKSHYYTVYDMVRDIFYVPGARHQGNYPIGVDFWLDVSSQTADSLYALKDAALRQTQAYVDELDVGARHLIYSHLILLILAFLLCAYSFRTVIYRVIHPINDMVEALLDVTEGKTVAYTPPAVFQNDEIGKLARILQAFQSNMEEINRTSAALTESENKLHQAQKMEAIGNLTGGMAHDFNNLLGVIIGNLDLLEEHLDKNEMAKTLAHSALDAALRGSDLTRRLLAFARKQPLQPQSIRINRLVDGISKLLNRILGEDIEIILHLSGDIWNVVVDPAQLESALTNLATNARDAMPHGGQLIVATRNCTLDADYATQHNDVKVGDYVLIEVSDNGTGMPPDVVNRIFEPFFTTKERGKGTGLGLAMVFGFIKQSGGHINVYSEVGGGTTFRLYLPRARGNEEIAAVPAASVPITGGHETILVVEDNEAMRNVVVRQLTDLGYHVLESENAQQAIELLTENNGIHLLFTDIVMPGKLNGVELAHLAQERWPTLKIILTSGFPETKLNGGSEGLIGFRLLGKPYRKEDLARTLREILGPHEAAPQG